MDTRVTRRSLLGASALIGTNTLRQEDNAISSGPTKASSLQEMDASVGEAVAPSWRFIVHVFEDPYALPILRPEEPEPGMRYVGAEVEIRNDSDAALNFSANSIRLQDVDAIGYSSGTVRGSDPRILDINLIPGERTRGWVWFAVPQAIQLQDLSYVAPSPRLIVPLSIAPRPELEATPLPPGF